MAELCCTTMKASTRTREELLADPTFADHPPPDDYEPIVRWEPGIGAYVIAYRPIYYCPWCGAQLPNQIEEALAEARKTGTWISVDQAGHVTAEVAGTPVDPSDLIPSDLIEKLSETESDG